jgi:hypothetical protein
MKAINRGNGSSWKFIVHLARAFMVAGFLFCASNGFAGNSTNTLWLSLSGVSNGWLTLTLNGTQPGSNYTLLFKQTLADSSWITAGTMTGATNQDWTAVSVPLGAQSSCFFQAQSAAGQTPIMNLWIARVGISSGKLVGIVSNSQADVTYEIQSLTDLSQAGAGWSGSEGFVLGSEATNWTPFSVAQNGRTNLFLRIRSWADSTGSGIPDWWWLQYFGQITNVDAYAADPAGDGYSDLQKFQMGINPTNYYNPNAPVNFFGCLDATGTNIVLEWSSSSGPVTGYVIQHGIYNNTTGNYDYTQVGLANSNATYFKVVGAYTNTSAQDDAYQLQAVYPGGSLSGASTWYVGWYFSWGSEGPPYGPPAPGNFWANADATGTNVLLSWTSASSAVTNYLILQGIYNPTNYAYLYTQITNVNPNTTNFEIFGALTNGSNWTEAYEIQAVYPGGGLSAPVTTLPNYYSSSSSINVGVNTNGPAAPGNFYGYPDSTGTNIFLTWSPVSGAVTNYIIYGGVYDNTTDLIIYHQLGRVGAGTNTFEVVGGVDGSGNNLYYIYNVVAVYTNRSLSQSAAWQPGNGAPPPGALSAYLDSTGTNVVLTWTAAQGAVTGYIIQRSDYYGESGSYYQIGQVNANTTLFEDIDAVDNGDFGLDWTMYEVQATYPNGGLSPAVTATIATTPPAPSNLSVSVSGANAVLSWTPVLTPGVTYTIERGVYNPNTGTYSYAQVGQTSATTFTDMGAITGNNSYNDVYEVTANYPGGQTSTPDEVTMNEMVTPPGQNLPGNNLTLMAQMVRNQTGRWQLMFSGLSTNVQAIALDWYNYDYFYDAGPFANPEMGFPLSVETDIPVSSLTNGVYVIPDFLTLNAIVNGFYFNTGGGWDMELAPAVMVQPIATDGTYGNQIMAGILSEDEPAFADGRQCLKQNLLFELRGATISNICGGVADTNYAESSIFQWTWMWKGYGGNNFGPWYIQMDNLLPFTVNYNFHQNLYDPNYQGPSSFVWQTNVATIPAPAVLGIGDPYWISQGLGNLADVAAYTSGNYLYLQGGSCNLFGLSFAAALVDTPGWHINMLGQWDDGSLTTLSPGGSVSEANVSTFYSQTADPNLQLVNYYFAPVATQGTWVTGDSTPYQAYPIPTLTGFANTNQTGVMIASVGTPTVIGGWAKFAIQNGNPNKFAYLGQYYITNAFVMTNGIVTTNTTGVVSPYGDFFPTEPGAVAMITMPDIDTGQQGTGVVQVISLVLDKNHDGTMDTSFAGLDNTSQANPMVWWVNNDNDGTGIGKDIEVMPGTPVDYQYGNIRSQRNLEDFSRLWVCGLPKLPTTNGYAITLSMSAVSGSPAINLYRSFDTNGSASYLSNTNAAAAQFTQWYLGDQLIFDFAQKLGTINSSQTYNLPVSTDGTPDYTHFLFEGAGIGEGQLTMTISQNGNTLAQSSVWLDLHDVKDFYERTVITNNISGTISNWTSGVESVQPAISSLGDDTNLIVLVHGINVDDGDWRIESDTVLKRLYWAGFHGKFATVKWPCNFFDWSLLSTRTSVFNQSEAKAYKAGAALKTYIDQLHARFPGYRLNLLVHSQGNAVASEAIEQGATFDTYILTQGALPASAYDVAAPTDAGLLKQDAITPTPEWQPMGYHGVYTNMPGRIVNFYNTNDPVLEIWMTDQGPGKPDGYLDHLLHSEGIPVSYYDYDGVDSWYNAALIIGSHMVTDPQESRAMVSRSRTRPIGQSPPESGHGVIQSGVDLHTRYGFNKAFPDDHSAQWTWPIQTTRPYFQQVLTSCQLNPAP